MGGYGSGRTSQKTKAEGCRSLDVNRLKRDGCLDTGRSGDWVWSRDGEEVARIGYRSSSTELELKYLVRLNGGDWEPITQLIPLTYVSCYYGNQRPYFHCPGVVNGKHCGRRVGKLFAGGKYFLCRNCYKVTYTSQSEAKHCRALRRANKLRIALGGEPGTAHWIAPKPKGMWQRTYQRKRREIEHHEHAANLEFLNRYQHLLNQADRDLVSGS